MTDAVLECAATFGWLCIHHRPARTEKGWRTLAQGNGAKGFPDCILIRGGCLIAAELKVGRNKPTYEQDVWLESFRHAGALVAVWTDRDWTSGAVEALLRTRDSGASQKASPGLSGEIEQVLR